MEVGTFINFNQSPSGSSNQKDANTEVREKLLTLCEIYGQKSNMHHRRANLATNVFKECKLPKDQYLDLLEQCVSRYGPVILDCINNISDILKESRNNSDLIINFLMKISGQNLEKDTQNSAIGFSNFEMNQNLIDINYKYGKFLEAYRTDNNQLYLSRPNEFCKKILSIYNFIQKFFNDFESLKECVFGSNIGSIDSLFMEIENSLSKILKELHELDETITSTNIASLRVDMQHTPQYPFSIPIDPQLSESSPFNKSIEACKALKNSISKFKDPCINLSKYKIGDVMQHGQSLSTIAQKTSLIELSHTSEKRYLSNEQRVYLDNIYSFLRKLKIIAQEFKSDFISTLDLRTMQIIYDNTTEKTIEIAKILWKDERLPDEIFICLNIEDIYEIKHISEVFKNKLLISACINECKNQHKNKEEILNSIVETISSFNKPIPASQTALAPVHIA